MYGKYYKLISIIGFLAIAAALEDQPTFNKNFTVRSSTNRNPGPSVLFTRIGEKYYFIETEEKKNWYEAYATCSNIGAHLVGLNSVKEWNAVVNHLTANNLHSNQYWTSGNDLGKQGNHIWFPTGDPIPSDIWGPGEPNNVGDNEHCDELKGQYALKLNDAPCSILLLYICELPRQVN